MINGNDFLSLAQVDVTDCKICTSGEYCPTSGAEFTAGNCSNGYYCPPGQNTSTPDDYRCPVGHFCPAGSQDPIRCYNGTYQDQEYTSECKDCPPGMHVDNC